jgi:hypothetical protein
VSGLFFVVMKRDAMFLLTPVQEARFWSKVSIGDPDECWPWLGCRNKKGYGVVRVNRWDLTSHRVSFTLSYGIILSDTNVCHSCDNPPCCNPEHLFLGSHEDNQHDKMEKGRGPNGEKNGHAVLTEDQVIAIRGKHRPGKRGFGCNALAAEYGVDRTTVSDILNGSTWKHLHSNNSDGSKHSLSAL